MFHAANATMTRMTTKMTPPVVTSTGKPLSEISANAARESGGTTSRTISTMKTKEAIAPVLASCGSPMRRAKSVNSAVANPARTSNVTRIARHHEDKGFRIADCGLRISVLAAIPLFTSFPLIGISKFAIRNSQFAILQSGTLIVFRISCRTVSASSLRRMAEE